MRMTKATTHWSPDSEKKIRQRFLSERGSFSALRSGVLIAFLLIISTILAGCVREYEGDTGSGPPVQDPQGGDPYFHKEIEIENAYFQGSASFPLQASYSYWVRRGDPVAIRWDTHEWHWEREHKICNFTDNSSGADCQNCDYCAQRESLAGLPCLGILPDIGAGSLDVMADSGFFATENPTSVFTFTGPEQLVGACSSRPEPNFAIPTFTPQASGLHRLFSRSRVLITGQAAGQVKIFLLDDASPQQNASYEMSLHPVTDPASCTPGPDDPTTVDVDEADCAAWYRWSMSGDPFWEDNFSPNLRATKVRILKGVPSMDINTGRFKLDELTTSPVRPSRIVLIPEYDQRNSVFGNDTIRCYSNTSADGDLDLRRCRGASGVDCNDPRDPLCSLPATPTYLSNAPLQKLTWFAEFKFSEGGVFPTLAAGEVLVVEFTMERN